MFADDPPNWLASLNPAQRRAATAPRDRPLLVLAGAGTGKTTTLCARVAWLSREGIPSERLLLITFTRRAARELLARTSALLGRNGAGPRVVGGTFHSVAHRLVRMYAEPLGLAAGFSIVDAGDAADLMDLVREELGLAEGERRFPRKATLVDIYSRTVNAQRRLADVLAESFPWCLDHREALGDIFRAYGERKRRARALDLDDLLLYWHALLDHETLGPKVARLFEHVLVDEYQDVNALQASIAAALCREHRGLTVVGDDMQAIFGFRAAEPRHILEFSELHADAGIVKLELNYRAPQPLLDVGNTVAAEARRTHPKWLEAERDGGSAPELHECRDEAEQAALVAAAILRHHEAGLQLRDQAVLMRAGHHSHVLELELGRRDIPFVKYGGIRYLDAAHVRDYVAALRLAVNPYDYVSWFRVLQLLDGVGPSTARAVADRLEPAAAGAFSDAWSVAGSLVPEHARSCADRLASAVEPRPPPATAAARAQLVLEAIAPLVRARYADGDVRLHDLRRLADAVGGTADLASFVADLVLDAPRSSSAFGGPPKLDEDYVVLSTIHSAKGLEWDVVHLIHASDGNLPSDMALTSPEGLEEERRLFYVAVTRPRRALHVYVPLRYYHRPAGRDDAHGYGKRSRFLSDAVVSRFVVSAPPRASPEQTAPTPGTSAVVAVGASVDDLFR